MTVGAFSTPITGGGAGTVLDQDQPEAFIGIPDGTAFLPLSVRVQCQVPLLATDADEAEILLAADVAATIVSGATQTTETPQNLITSGGVATTVAAFSAATANITNPTLGVELARSVVTGDVQGTPANALWTNLSMVYEPEVPYILKGPASLLLYFGGTVAVPGFAQFVWAEVPENRYTI